ncbi:MAG: hypothetical protein E6Z83_01285 [Pantoea sp.]|uniref:hypothetical protein n=1 Tax=Pantoea sp. TaxID=69393 RepID=UPI00290FC467|nr:hypothetical protein [Pantoea sp.]MDU5779419.1 hypothetical protein [Pantoea sp.]
MPSSFRHFSVFRHAAFAVSHRPSGRLARAPGAQIGERQRQLEKERIIHQRGVGQPGVVILHGIISEKKMGSGEQQADKKEGQVEQRNAEEPLEGEFGAVHRHVKIGDPAVRPGLTRA